MANLRPQAKPFRLGTKAPDFKAVTTKGPISLHNYKGESWLILFCCPQDFGPVATTELVVLTKLEEEFFKCKTKLLALSTGTLETHQKWETDIEEISKTTMKFPVIVDQDRTISHLYHIVDDDDLEGDISENALTTRSAFIIGPDNTFRLIFNYPSSVGMNIAELLRSLECLQIAENDRGISTPANWSNGGDVVVHTNVSDKKAKELFPKIVQIKPYLRFAEFPRGSWSVEHLVFHEGHLQSINLESEGGLLKVTHTGNKTALLSG